MRNFYVGLQALASSCFAHQVEFPAASGVTTRLTYDVNVPAMIQVHDPPDREALRRLAETAPVVDVSVDPEHFYYYKHSTGMIIYGSTVRLSNMLYSPSMDLEVYAAELELFENMTFRPPTGKKTFPKVHLHANSVKVLEPMTLRALGTDGENMGLPGRDGRQPGEAGRNGPNGENGGQGGSVIIEANTIEGFPLTIDVSGGNGGKGQDGGNGAQGASGATPDSQACCQVDTTTKGGDGGKGGAAGKGGNGGVGGRPGSVVVRTPHTASLNLTVVSEPGKGGQAGVAGKPGAAGMGGAGSNKKCVNIGTWFHKDYRCFLPQDERGAPGAIGDEAVAGTDGTPGQQGRTVHVKETSVEDLRKAACGEHLRYEMTFADDAYLHGNIAAAVDAYKWIAAVGTDPTCEKELEVPWREIVEEAQSRLDSIAMGLDYFNEEQGHVSRLSFEELERIGRGAVSLARDAEKSYYKYSGKAADEVKDNADIDAHLANLDGQIESHTQIIEKGLNTIETLRADITDMIAKQAAMEQALLTDRSGCESAVHKQEAKETYGFVPTFKRVVKFVGKAIVLTSNLYVQYGVYRALAENLFTAGKNLGMQMKGEGKLIFNELTGKYDFAKASAQAYYDEVKDIPLDYVGVVSDIDNVSMIVDHSQRVIDHSKWLAEKAIDDVNSLKDNILGYAEWLKTRPLRRRDDVMTYYNQVLSGVNKFQGDAEATWKQLSQNFEEMEASDLTDEVKFIVDEGQHDTLLEWVRKIPECSESYEGIRALARHASILSSKKEAHDKEVKNLLAKDLRRSKLISDRIMAKNLAVGTYDPELKPFLKSISQIYKTSKEGIIEVLRAMNEASDFEFCENSAFITVPRTRVLQLDAALQEAVHRRHVKRTTSSQRGRVQNPSKPGLPLTPATVITITRDSHPVAFESFYRTNKLIYSLPIDHPSLPAGVANVRVVAMQGFSPDLMHDNGGDVYRTTGEMWMRQAGVSECKSTTGQYHKFSHKEYAYYSIFSTVTAKDSPRWLTAVVEEDFVGPSPVGQWEISFPALDHESAREHITEVQLHFVLEYTPCTTADCNREVAPKTASSMSRKPRTPATTKGPAHEALGWTVTVAAIFGVSLAFVGFLIVRKMRAREVVLLPVQIDPSIAREIDPSTAPTFTNE